LVYFTAIWYTFNYTVCGHFAYFYRFGMFELRKIWQPCSEQGDQIGRLFAYWVIVYFGQFF
jgi:hypothetical protein